MRSDLAECLLQGREREKRSAGLIRKSDPMRPLVLACFVMLAGYIIDNDPVRVENFTADTPATFTYDAWTNTVMTANDDGAAEENPTRLARRGARRQWDVRGGLRRRDAPLRATLGGAVRQWRRHRLHRTLPVARRKRRPRSFVSRVRRRQRSMSGPEFPWTGSPASSGTAAIRGNARA